MLYFSLLILEELKEEVILLNEIMVSFDFTFLFTSISQDLAVKTIKVLQQRTYGEKGESEALLQEMEATEETNNLIQRQISSLLMAHQPREVHPKFKRVALTALKADRDIFSVPANKGRSTVRRR
ncbi:unnamed protein product [Dibothriocephalus latus]|uniref:Uncharacterized protein n=1 Tax=Dibothriocephalus latus TaxID=60516 RepID=A0A3P7LRK8_DIBLA|nr:unnamed protein product [Dibothriocephalus latus]